MLINGVDRLADERKAKREAKEEKALLTKAAKMRGRVKHSGRTYNTWAGMKQRCLVDPLYVNRGITVCERWLESYENFHKDMGPRPVGLEIDRINNELGYFKENCRWTTRSENMKNTRRGSFLNVIPSLTDKQADYVLDSITKDLKEK